MPVLPSYRNQSIDLLCKLLGQFFVFYMIIRLLRSQNFPKNKYFLSPDTHSTFAYQGVRNVCFSENFENVLKECSLFTCVGNSIQRCWFKREYSSSSEDISRKYDFLSILVSITFWHSCFWLNTTCTVYCLQYDW